MVLAGRLRAIFACMFVAALFGCHSSTSPNATPTPGETNSTSGEGSQDASAVTATDDQGFSYELKVVSPPQAQPSVTVDYGSLTHNAPPGKEFVTVALEVTNTTDREEPLPIDPSCCSSVFHIGVPIGQAADFDALDINDDCNIALANDVCDVFTEVDSVDPPHQFEQTPQIPAGGTVKLVLSTLNEVPSTVALGSIELFFTHPISGDPAVEIPIPVG
jgi:hypothetical protein